jgi:hypothetical protein
MSLYSINPYNNFQAANLKEYISLDKGAKQEFHPKTRFDLIPGNSDPFSSKIKKCSKQFGYGPLLNVPTNRNVDATDTNAITYKDPINIIDTWNKITDDLIAKNANETWGTCNWTIPINMQIEALSDTGGELGVVAVISKIGKKKFMERWKFSIFAYQVMALLTPEDQASIKIHKKAYLWTDPLTDEIVEDGRLLLNEVLKLMRPDVQANVYMELAKIKSIKPFNYAFNMVKWHSAIKSKCIMIEQKLPGSYHELQYIMDYLDAAHSVEVKSFKAEVSIIRNRYLCGNPDKWTALYINGKIIKTYNNMSEDGTWKCKIGEKDQIIALTMKVSELQSKLEKQVAAFATQAKKEITPVEIKGPRHNKKDGPYTVALR